MCMATVFLKRDNIKQEILRDVADIKIQGKNIIISSLFGKKKSLEAKIEEIDFLNSQVLLTPIFTLKEGLK